MVIFLYQLGQSLSAVAEFVIVLHCFSWIFEWWLVWSVFYIILCQSTSQQLSNLSNFDLISKLSVWKSDTVCLFSWILSWSLSTEIIFAKLVENDFVFLPFKINPTWFWIISDFPLMNGLTLNLGPTSLLN